MTDQTVASSGSQRRGDGAGDKLDDVADKTDEKLDEHPWVEWLPKAGWLARGFVYAFMGWTVLLISFQKDSADEASTEGAVVALADRSFGQIAIGALAVGLAALVVWQALTLALMRDTDAKAWLKRLSAVTTMVIYGGLAFTATRAALGMSADNGGGIERMSKGLLSSTPGRIVVFVGGAIALGVAGYRAYKGWEHKFLKHLDLDGCDPGRRKLIARLGAVGWIGRAFVVGLVAVFAMWAAVTADPDNAVGFDQGLRKVSVTSWGFVLVAVAGLALIAYGLFCVVSLKYREIRD
jgi:hypothetical protein